MTTQRIRGLLAESPPNPWMLSDLVLCDADGEIVGFVESLAGITAVPELIGKYISSSDFDVSYPSGPLPLYLIRKYEITEESMLVKLVYRLKHDVALFSDNSATAIEATTRERQRLQLEKLGVVKPTKRGFEVGVDGEMVNITSSWLANALVVNSTPDVHFRLQSGLEIEDIHPDYEYFLADFGSNDIVRIESLRERGEPRSLWHHDLLEIEELRNEHSITGDGVRVGILDTGISAGPGLVEKLQKYAYVDQEARLHLDRVAGEPSNLSHGTHVAGCIASDKYGLAPGVRLFVASVNNGVNGFSKWSQINTGLEWLVSEGVHAINLSLGGPGYRDDLDDQLRACQQRGIAVFAAVGNVLPGKTLYPGNSPLTVSVGAMAKSGELIVRSGSDGTKPNFVAPGEDIISTYRDNGFGSMSGTSQATPQATSIFAILKQYRPQATTEQIVDAMQRCSKPLARVPSERQGSGLLNLRASLEYLESLPADGALPQQVYREEFSNVSSLQVDLASAFVKVVADRNDNTTVVEVSDENSPLVRGVHIAMRNGALTITPVPSQIGSNYIITVNCPYLAYLRVSLASGIVQLEGRAQNVTVSTVSGDVTLGKSDQALGVQECLVKSVSGKIVAFVPSISGCAIEYRSLSGYVVVQPEFGSEVRYSGSGALGNPTASARYALQTVSREIRITEIGN